MSQDTSYPVFLSAIWLLLGVVIFIGNTLTVVLMWRSKRNREKEVFGLRIHAMWIREGINVAFAVVGLTLIITSIVRLSSDGKLTRGTCDILGFLLTFFFHFGAMGTLISLLDRVLCLFRPFVYHAYTRRKSYLPFIALGFCTLYGAANAIPALVFVKSGDYSQKTMYSTCILNRDRQLITRYIGLFNISIEILIFSLLLVQVWQLVKLVRLRKKLNVRWFKPEESTIFSFVVSSLFLICWLPYLITMLVSTYEDVGDKGKTAVFGVALIPLVLNSVLSCSLHGHCRKEFLACWQSLKHRIVPVKDTNVENIGNHENRTVNHENRTVNYHENSEP